MAKGIKITAINSNGKEIKLPIYMVIGFCGGCRQFFDKCEEAVEAAYEKSKGGNTTCVIDLQIGHMFAYYKNGQQLEERFSICDVHNAH